MLVSQANRANTHKTAYNQPVVDSWLHRLPYPGVKSQCDDTDTDCGQGRANGSDLRSVHISESERAPCLCLHISNLEGPLVPVRAGECLLNRDECSRRSILLSIEET